MKFTLNLTIGFEISEDFMEDELSFNEGVVNGDITIGDLDFSIVDEQTNEKIEMDGVQNDELLALFTQTLSDKAGAK